MVSCHAVSTHASARRDELTPADAATVLRAAAATAGGRALGPNELRAAVAALQHAAGLAGDTAVDAARDAHVHAHVHDARGRGIGGSTAAIATTAVAAMKLPVPDTFGVLAPSSALLHAWGAPASLLARVDPRRLRLAHPLVPWAVCAAAGIRATRDAVTEQRFLTEAEEMGQGTDAVDTLGSGRSNLSFDTSGGDGGGGDFSLDTDRHLSATHPSGNESLDSERHLSASPPISGGISGGEVGDLHELTAAATVFTSSNEPAMPLPVLEAAVAAAPAAIPPAVAGRRRSEGGASWPEAEAAAQRLLCDDFVQALFHVLTVAHLDPTPPVSADELGHRVRAAAAALVVVDSLQTRLVVDGGADGGDTRHLDDTHYGARALWALYHDTQTLEFWNPSEELRTLTLDFSP